MMLAHYLLSKVARVSGKVPIRIILVVPFVVQIFAAVGITGWLSLRNGQKAVHDVATQLQSQISQRIQQNLRSYLATPHQVNESNAVAISLGQLKVQDLAGLERHFWQQLRIFNSLNSITLGNEQKEFIGVENLANNVLVTMESNKSTGYHLKTYFSNSNGDRLKLSSLTKNYDPRNRPWYQAAVTAGKPTWSGIFPQFTTKTLNTAAVMPVYDKQNNLLGVASIGVNLSKVGDFLRTLKIGKTGQTFIIERSGMLVATSTNENLFRNNNKPERFKASESRDPLTQATAKYLAAHDSNLNKLESSQELEFYRDGRRQFLQVMPFQDDKGLDWLIVVVVPEADFMEQIDANTRTTIILCLLALGVATLVGILTARWITQPILRLKDAATALADGQFDSALPIVREDELGLLAQVFVRMAGQLQESFERLESRVEERTAKLQESENRERERALELENTLRELQRTQSLIIQTEKMSSLGQMVAGVAHEINNPVNFIYGNLTYTSQYTQDLLHLIQLYQKHYPHPVPEIEAEIEEIDLEFLCEDFPNVLDSMRIGTERIRQIVLSLRNFSRLDEADKKPVNIHEGIDSTLLILQNRWKATSLRSGIQILKEYGDLPEVECYAGKLNQVFMNIISNAIDALEEGVNNSVPREGISGNEEEFIGNGQLLSPITPNLSPAIRIRTTILDNNRIEIRITDNGSGMTEEVQSKIFDPFFTTKPVGQGTGLGLSISYQIVVEKHGGQLQCISAPGKGAEFVITIPQRQTRDSDEAKTARTRSHKGDQ